MCFIGAAGVRADVLANYVFSSATPLVSGDTDPNSTAGNMTAVSGLIGAGYLAFPCPFTAGLSCGSASFTLTPAIGYELNLQDLTFRANNERPPASLENGTVCWAMTTSLDAYAATVGSGCWVWIAAGGSPVFTVSLAGGSFQHLNAQNLAGGSLGIRLSFVSQGGAPVTCECSYFPAELYYVTLNGAATADSDYDGVADTADDCMAVSNPTQLDSDGDGYGNVCDPDFDNNGTVNINDFNRLKARLGITPVTDLVTDLDGNGAVNINDINRLKSYLGKPPGPSALHPNCPPTCP